MDITSLVESLENYDQAEALLRSWGIVHPQTAWETWQRLPETGLTLDLIGVLSEQLAQTLSTTNDPDRVLINFVAFVEHVRNPISFGAMCERDVAALPGLLHLLSVSPRFTEYLIHDPDAFDLVRLTDGQPTPRRLLQNDIVAEVLSQSEERAQKNAIRRIHSREMLRIIYGDIVHRQLLAVTMSQISYLADALVEAAWQCTCRKFLEMKAFPLHNNGEPFRIAILAFGKFGGEELSYEEPLELAFLSEPPSGEPHKLLAIHDSFERIAKHFIKLLTDAPAAYNLQFSYRPKNSDGSLIHTYASALHYYDTQGRTWERQAFIKARVAAGNAALGQEYLTHLQPWVYRRYLQRADITGIQALKRRIEQRSQRQETPQNDLHLAAGALLDIENTVAFLQLLNGGDLPEVRQGNTLRAIESLQTANCLTAQEASTLSTNYVWLRQIEHALQIMTPHSNAVLPHDAMELRKLAFQLSTEPEPYDFSEVYSSRLLENIATIHQLLKAAFPHEPPTAPEVDLVLDPAPNTAWVEQVLAKYGFNNIAEARENLLELSHEKIPFLSTRRCRHFLANIVHALLHEVSATPHADSTLRNIVRVSDSLGGKGVLWELFSVHPPMLHLYTTLCAVSPYLSDILVSNPGMLDELLDSLLLDKLPTATSLAATLNDLCRGADAIEPMLMAFKNSLHLRVGVRDILGKEQIANTQKTLANVMETILLQVTQHEYARLVEKHGEPRLLEGPRQGEACELLLVAMGKLGGQEPNYQSDCDVLFLYEGDGMTKTTSRKAKSEISNQHFFGTLAQRIIKSVTQRGPFGKLFEINTKLRPTGQAGPLAVSLADFTRYYAEGNATLAERQVLCKARIIQGSDLAKIKTQHILRQAILAQVWQPDMATELLSLRLQQENNATCHNIKRATGGLLDVEYYIQALQLQHCANTPQILQPNSLNALTALHQNGLISTADCDYWNRACSFLRRVESALRLRNAMPQHDLPTSTLEEKQLAYLLHMTAAELAEQIAYYRSENRRRLLELLPA
jgi:[glutamine synthetase] adenylyltransferase / [glutamine synthetase]-adenylyl-L-tyrosine phosphorylase